MALFKGVGQNAEDNKHVDRVLTNVRANAETVFSTNGAVLNLPNWVRKARSDMVWLNGKWKVKHGMAKEMQNEYMTAWEQDVDPDYLRDLEQRAIQSFKMNHARSDNLVYPHRPGGTGGKTPQGGVPPGGSGGKQPPAGGHGKKQPPTPPLGGGAKKKHHQPLPSQQPPAVPATPEASSN